MTTIEAILRATYAAGYASGRQSAGGTVIPEPTAEQCGDSACPLRHRDEEKNAYLARMERLVGVTNADLG